jgi:hypothetical protein
MGLTLQPVAAESLMRIVQAGESAYWVRREREDTESFV